MWQVRPDPTNRRREVEADNIHLQFGTVGVLDHGANDGILDFAVVQVDADFVADLKLALWFLGWHARNVRWRRGYFQGSECYSYWNGLVRLN